MNERLKVLDLFSGIGGFSLGLERTGGFETVAFCEIEPFCQQVLRKHWPAVHIFEDVRELTSEQLGPIDVICGGYPCQPFSQAGKRKGEADDRHLWPEVRRLVASIRPAWCLFENVAGHITLGLDQVLSDLENEGYTCWPLVIPACAVDAPHRRDRVWIVANAQCSERRPRQFGENVSDRENAGREKAPGGFGTSSPHDGKGPLADADSDREQQPQGIIGKGGGRAGDGGQDVPDSNIRSGKPGAKRGGRKAGANPSGRGEGTAMADADSNDQHGRRGPFQVGRIGRQGKVTPDGNTARTEWSPEPAVGRVAYGVPNRVDRLKSLGNAVVPQIPEIIGRAILEAEGLK